MTTTTPQPGSVTKAPNVSEPDAYCFRCGNLGWVELAGTLTRHGVTYDRGMAPCKWCELGQKRFQRAISPPRDKHDAHRPWRPLEDFTEADIVPVGFPDGERPRPPEEPLTRQLPGMEDAPAIDLEAGARSTYMVWRRELGKELADARLRQRTGPDGEPLDRLVYPLEIVELVIAEADALDAPLEPSTEEESI